MAAENSAYDAEIEGSGQLLKPGEHRGMTGRKRLATVIFLPAQMLKGLFSQISVD